MQGYWLCASSQIVHSSLDRKKKTILMSDIKWAFCKKKMDFMLTDEPNPGSDPTLIITNPPCLIVREVK